ncbi:hypothetical protein MBLNU459_g0337t1 [Dothideomycetes sp. NU459]
MALTSLLESIPLAQAVPLGLSVGLVTLCIYRLYFHPLAHVPGPLICRVTSLWTHYHAWAGDEARLITAFHARYGPVLRIAPNEVCIADGSALAPIYSDRGGFAKAPCYRNFDIDGFASLFSETVRERRAPKAKSVVPLFSTANLRAGEEVLESCVARLVARLRRARDESAGGPVDLLNLSRSLALDAVTAYLFGKRYGGLDEDKSAQMSASEFVDAFVSVGRFFYLPNWIFVAVEMASEKLYGTKEMAESMGKVDAFVWQIVNEAEKDGGSYPSRMLKLGLTPDEVVGQCKDLIFAGTDSSGMNLSTLCWQLARHPEAYKALRSEVQTARAQNPSGYDASTLPYLRCCIREALRLSMANPTRLPRVVPPGGWTFIPRITTTTTTKAADSRPHHFPAGTLVSCQIHTLHLNPAVFERPLEFRPDRWTDDAATPDMLRDSIPFGLGARQCIARNLAMAELTLAGRAIVESGVLDGAEAVGDKVEIVEWFNSHVVGEKIEVVWKGA